MQGNKSAFFSAVLAAIAAYANAKQTDQENISHREFVKTSPIMAVGDHDDSRHLGEGLDIALG